MAERGALVSIDPEANYFQGTPMFLLLIFEGGTELLPRIRAAELVDMDKASHDTCSTLPCPGYSMWNPWKGAWTAEIPDGFHGMGDGFHTFGGWIPYLFHTFSTWIPYFSCGFHTFSSWILYLFQLDSIPFPYGIQLE